MLSGHYRDETEESSLNEYKTKHFLFDLVRENMKKINIIDLGLQAKMEGIRAYFLKELQVTHHLDIKALGKIKFNSLLEWNEESQTCTGEEPCRIHLCAFYEDSVVYLLGILQNVQVEREHCF